MLPKGTHQIKISFKNALFQQARDRERSADEQNIIMYKIEQIEFEKCIFSAS